MLSGKIDRLVEYGIRTGLTSEEERVYTRNLLLDAMHETDYTEGEVNAVSGEESYPGEELEEILADLLDEAVAKGLIHDDVTSRDLFDTRLMNCLLPRPAEVRRTFREKYAVSPQAATDYYYKFSQDSDYIRRYRVCKDLRWKAPSTYGDLDISINLSKPEKDPRAIAAARNAKTSGYPRCQLCLENEGYAGRVNHPARENHRIIPLTIDGMPWFFQYSPYVYYNEHCIVFNSLHTPMKIDRAAFRKLFSFIGQFPHYTLGSNADLPIVGGSILSHDHFQGGCYEFPMARAGIEEEVSFMGYEDVRAGILNWPMSVIRLDGEDPERIVDLADRILTSWRGYTDETAFIYAETEGEPHNTITPIARRRGDLYELDLVLRNNITTEEHPLGVFHPHQKLHHIKKENIGLIEVMGLAILPSRLKQEMKRIEEVLLSSGDLREDPLTVSHAEWVEEFLPGYDNVNEENIREIIKKEIGRVFTRVLEDAGVYKCTEEGRAAFRRFLSAVPNPEA